MERPSGEFPHVLIGEAALLALLVVLRMSVAYRDAGSFVRAELAVALVALAVSAICLVVAGLLVVRRNEGMRWTRASHRFSLFAMVPASIAYGAAASFVTAYVGYGLIGTFAGVTVAVLGTIAALAWYVTLDHDAEHK